jgi:hypothetical protein
VVGEGKVRAGAGTSSICLRRSRSGAPQRKACEPGQQPVHLTDITRGAWQRGHSPLGKHFQNQRVHAAEGAWAHDEHNICSAAFFNYVSGDGLGIT